MKLHSVVAFVVCVLSARCAFAFPTQAEIKTATDVVGSLVADDVRAANSGKAKHEDVAKKIRALVDQANTDAAKWVLFKNAFIQYAKAGDFTKAGEVLTDTLSAFPDVPPKMLLAVIEKNCAKANTKNAPVIAKARNLMYMRQTCFALTSRGGGGDKTSIAEAYCLLGEWDKGLKQFASAGGKTGKIASAELNGSKPKHEIADYWWNYDCDLDTCDQFKAHAADLYRAGLADGSIDGLYKNVAEKRISETKFVPVVAAAPSATKTNGLIHRWSFNNNVRDSVGKSHGKVEGSVTYKNNAVILPGGGKTAGAINLGNKLLPGDKDFTLEIWAALNHTSWFAPLVRLQYPGEKSGSHKYKNQFVWTWSSGDDDSHTCITAPYRDYYPKTQWKLDELYHIVIVGTKTANGGMSITYMKAGADDSDLVTLAKHTGSAWTTETLGLWLGRRLYTDDPNVDTDAAATYDEVRIWDRPLTQEELAKSHKAGPDMLF